MSQPPDRLGRSLCFIEITSCNGQHTVIMSQSFAAHVHDEIVRRNWLQLSFMGSCTSVMQRARLA